MNGLLERGTLTKVFGGATLFALAVTGACSYNQLEQTERGIIYNLGEMSTKDASELIQPGPKFIVPFFQSMRKVNIGQQPKDYADVQTYTKDNQLITAKLTMMYKVPESIIVNLYKNNPGWEDQLQSVVYESFKSALGGQEAQSVAQSRNAIMENVTNRTKAEVARLLSGVEVVGVLMPDFHFEEAFEKSVEAAANEKAVLERKRTELEQSKVDAQKAEEAARGQANAARLAADASAYSTLKQKEAQAEGFKVIANAIGRENMNTYLLTEKWQGQVPTVQGGSGTILDMRSIAPAATPRPGGQ